MDKLDVQLQNLSLQQQSLSIPPVSSNASCENRNRDHLEQNLQSNAVTPLMRRSHGLFAGNNRSVLSEMDVQRVGPIVPPKPNKKNNDHLPQVPQSSIVRQMCEPLYSQRLHTAPKSKPSEVDQESLFLKKQPKDISKNKLFKMDKVTLDNPAILEQQLEALAHHKKQLERKGLLKQHEKQNSSNPHTFKLPSTSLLKSPQPSCGQTSPIYYNDVKHYNRCAMPETTKITTENPQQHNYLNIKLKKDYQQSPVLSYASRNNDTNYEENPPPPSPVSSSYSELRRATGAFPMNSNSLPKLHESCEDTDRSEEKCYYGDCSGLGKETKMMNKSEMYSNLNYTNQYSALNLKSKSSSQDFADYCGYGSFSQASSTYESIYEPINPRPTSQQSSRSNLTYSLMSGPQNTTEHEGNILNKSCNSNLSSLSDNNTNSTYQSSVGNFSSDLQQEAEVKALTDILDHSADPATDTDSYGICFNCNERVLGESSGCTAMDQIYHTACFTCSQCQINLQGKPFFALEGKPYCESDYLQTLEKCSVCMKPILERILRATGKPYHPQCFTCVVCGNSLDGIPFTVDATNQNYCISDFHKKFAPRCCVCKEPIMPESGEDETIRVVALDRSFHLMCYKCEDCGLLLSSEAEGRGCYPLDDHILCKSCNAKRVQTLSHRMVSEYQII